jgi:polyhydroxyalkanoate synthesis regulator phasin
MVFIDLCWYSSILGSDIQLLRNCIEKLILGEEIQVFPMDNNNWLQQIVMMGIGTTSLVADKVREMSEELVKDGKINPDQAKTMVDDIMKQVKLDPGSVDEQMQRWLRNTMQDIGVPRQSEMDELRGRIDRLERQIREMENKLWR